MQLVPTSLLPFVDSTSKNSFEMPKRTFEEVLESTSEKRGKELKEVDDGKIGMTPGGEWFDAPLPIYEWSRAKLFYFITSKEQNEIIDEVHAQLQPIIDDNDKAYRKFIGEFNKKQKAIVDEAKRKGTRPKLTKYKPKFHGGMKVGSGIQNVIEMRYNKKKNEWLLYNEKRNLGAVELQDEAIVDVKPKKNEIKWRCMPKESYREESGYGIGYHEMYLTVSHLDLREEFDKQRVRSISFSCKYNPRSKRVEKLGDMDKVKLEDGNDMEFHEHGDYWC